MKTHKDFSPEKYKVEYILITHFFFGNENVYSYYHNIKNNNMIYILHYL